MVKFIAALVLCLAYGAATGQRKVNRNVETHRSEVKQVVNFNCPEEFGYYPHPSDCTQYYVCVFGGALLESCTGGLMYSHELQTCDWPRNVGCDGLELAPPASGSSSNPPIRSREREEPRARYSQATLPPAQPAAIVTSRGQPRQLQHQEIIKQRQQQQLYADAEEALPPAEEVENDRQQRVYRGQPSIIGQVQKDRDGLRHSNAISSFSERGERIGVISFGTGQQQPYSTIDYIETNDLTEKRRRKRQTQQSQIRSIQTSWRNGHQNYQTSHSHNRPHSIHPTIHPVYEPNPDEFQPFIPKYQIKPTYTNPLLSASNHRPQTHQTPNTTNESSEYEFGEFFGPPPSYFESRNKYENIKNPFADPEFNFDQFLTHLSPDRFPKPTTQIAKPRTTSRPKLTKTTKATTPLPPKTEDYYYEEERNVSTPAPPKKYSSQIKPTEVKKEEEYYYEYYDEPEPLNKKPIVVSTKGETKYSAKYQAKPKVTKTTTVIYPKTILTSESLHSNYVTETPTVLTATRPRNRPRHDVRVEHSSTTPVQAPVTATARTAYNSSQYSNNYDPYYALYDDDVELYRDIDYAQHYSSNNNNNNAAQQNQVAQQSYRRTPSPVVQTTPDDSPKRGNAAYIPNSYNSHDIYQPATVADYNEDNSYNSQVDDYRTINRQPSRNNLRGDRNDLNYFEEATTKRTTTTTARKPPSTTTTRTTTSRTFPPKKSTVQRLPENKTQAQSSINTLRQEHPIPPPDPEPSDSFKVPEIFKPAPFTLPEHLTTEMTVDNHYITKSSRSTTLVSTTMPPNKTVIVPTTYSPPKFFLKSFLPRPVVPSTTASNPSLESLKSVRKSINPINVNNAFSATDPIASSFEPEQNPASIIESSEETPRFTSLKPITEVVSLQDFINKSEVKHFRTTVEVPPPTVVFDDEPLAKAEHDQPPDYKLKPILNTTSSPQVPITHTPSRTSRVNTAIKSLIATRRQKCHDDIKCNKQKQRTSNRGRGSTHYSGGGGIVKNEVTVTVNRGTPASRPRPTLKPSTSIVSKATEFIDIYRFPPVRPDPIYPQPQPDKTAAKCRKDVCLLPDCSCGGKEIPGDVPVDETPQLVLLTFDDAVNDLNKQYYIDLFESGRQNPNGCPIGATFYVSHEWTDYSQVQNLYADGHEMASHTVSHSFGEQFSQKKWTREIAGQREILSAYGGVRLEDVRGMRAPFLSVGGNKMFKMLYDSNFTYDSSMPIYENKPPSWPYTLDYKLFHDCMIPPCPTRSYPGVWEVPMVMWQDLNGGRCSMGDACSNPPDSSGVFKMLTKNFQRHYTTNRAPFGLFYHAAWFTQPHHKEGFIQFLDSILEMKDVWLVTNWQALQWVRDPTPTSRLGSFQPFQCDFSNRPKRCNNPKVCNLWHKSGVRYMRTCQPCPDIYPWTGNSGIRSSRIDNDIED